MACLIGGLAGGSIALFNTSGLVAGFGFLCLAIAWLTCTIRAWLAVRRQDYLTHQRWMIRSFSLAFAAVMLRVYVPLSLAGGLGYADSYPVIAWLCWVPNRSWPGLRLDGGCVYIRIIWFAAWGTV